MGKRTARDEDWQPARTSRPRHESPSSTGRKPGRSSVACAQCRQRKSNCSLSGPACEACLSRGDGESCSYQALIWTDNPEDLPSRQLKRKVDRLEEMLKGLASPPRDTGLPSPPPTAKSFPVKPEPASPPLTFSTPKSAMSRSADRARTQAAANLMRSIMSGGDVPPLALPGYDAYELSSQLREVDQRLSSTLPYLDHPAPAALHAVVSPAEYERCVRAVLPTPQQAQLTISAFFAFANGFLRLIDPPTFMAECDVFWRTGNVPEPIWLATYLMVCGGGLVVAPSGDETYAALPGGDAKELLARTWMDGARRVLAANSFMLRPTIEGIRALHLLLHWWCAEGARFVEQSVSITASVISAAFDLQLNRDPDEVAPELAPAEKDLRRRLFHATFTYEAMVRPLIGNSWQPFDEEDITVGFPSDEVVHAEDGQVPTPHYTAALLNFRITKLVSRVKPPTLSEVAGIFDELEAIGTLHSQDPLRAAMVRWTYLRLHRFAHPAGLTSGAQDEVAAQYFAGLLDSVDYLSLAGAGTSTIVALKILSTAVGTAVDFAGTPYAIASHNPTIHQLKRLAEKMRTGSFPRGVDRLLARGVVVIEHLLPTADEILPGAPSLLYETASSVTYSSVPTPSTAGSLGDGHVSLVERFFEETTYADPSMAYLPTPAPVTVVPSYPTGPFYPVPPSGVVAAMPPPPQHPSILRTSRPALSLFTSMAPPAAPTKAPTPIALSPWVDAAITPSRYVGNQSWERFF